MIYREKNIVTLICDDCGKTFQTIAGEGEEYPIRRVGWRDLCRSCLKTE